MKPEDHELFLNVGQMCIVQGDSAQLLDFISCDKNQVNMEVSVNCNADMIMQKSCLKRFVSISYVQYIFT